MIYRFHLIVPSEIRINCVEDAFNMGVFYQLKVSVSMGTFSDS